MDQMEPFVLSVCSIHSGSKNNIIPDDAVLEGTIRTLNEKVRSQAKKHFEHVIRSVCKTFNSTCEIEFMQDTYPVTINDPKVTKKVISVLRTIKGTKTVEIKPILGAEGHVSASFKKRQAHSIFSVLAILRKTASTQITAPSSR